MRHLPNRRVGKASDHFLVNSNHAGVKTVRWASCQRESAGPLDPPTSLRCSHKLGLTVSFPHLLSSHNMRLFWSLEAVWSTVRRGAKRCGQQVADAASLALRHPSADAGVSNRTPSTMDLYIYIGPCQALLYHILAPIAAITDYAIGFWKLSANAVTDSFPWCSNGSTFVIDDSSYISLILFLFLYNSPVWLCHHNKKPKSFESKWNSFLYPGPMFTCVTGCFVTSNLISTDDYMAISVYAIPVNTQTFRKALTASVHGQIQEVRSSVPSVA